MTLIAATIDRHITQYHRNLPGIKRVGSSKSYDPDESACHLIARPDPSVPQNCITLVDYLVKRPTVEDMVATRLRFRSNLEEKTFCKIQDRCIFPKRNPLTPLLTQQSSPAIKLLPVTTSSLQSPCSIAHLLVVPSCPPLSGNGVVHLPFLQK